MTHVIPISGKDSLCTALVQTALHPDLDYVYVFADVGMELPETYAWLGAVERALGIEVVRLGTDLPGLIRRFDMIPSAGRRFCTNEGKVRPLQRWFRELTDGASSDGGEVTVYYGLRADEADRKGPVTGRGITAAFPLQRVGFDLHAVWGHLARESERRGVDLLPPAYEWAALRRAVERGLGEPEDGDFGRQPWELRELFAGRSRSNCYSCFYQRLYEWAWLLDTHPDLYDEAERLERETGRLQEPARETVPAAPLFGLPEAEVVFSRDEVLPFTWNPSWPLARLRGERDRLLAERAEEVGQRITALRTGRLGLGDDTPFDMARTSCGLLCGK